MSVCLSPPPTSGPFVLKVAITLHALPDVHVALPDIPVAVADVAFVAVALVPADVAVAVDEWSHVYGVRNIFSCTVSVGCGGVSSENCTYFDVGGAPNGACSATICPCSTGICQLRLDFHQFVIQGPSTSTVGAFKQVGGLPATSKKAPSASLSTNCLVDTFGVTSPGNNAPPVICGTNSGEHSESEVLGPQRGRRFLLSS